jgi:UDP-N-acetylglucosamine--N-acetylmuramyl-(pentapeptide) pyrophosphoryl-undecaprenol N-acetylglucosamine transferase
VTLGPVVIAAAGTGGHIYPGLALAEAIRRREPDRRIVFTGTPRGLENTLVPAAGYPLDLYAMVPLAGSTKWRAPFALVRSAFQARSILRRERASVAVSMGGYGGIPLVLGGKLSRVPIAVHESGAVAGRANVLAARFTPNVALSFDSAKKDFPHTSTVTTGMPLSGALAGFDRDALRADARRAYGLADGDRMVLVVGGSQGAATLNTAAVGLAERWSRGPHARTGTRILLKTGKANEAEVQAAITAKDCGGVITAQAYLDRMDHAYAAADVILARAGAGTVAEVAVAGLPAVFVPYPGAVDDHQAVNAGPLVDAGAAVLVRDDVATAERVASEIEPLLDDEALRSERASIAASLGHAHAADELAAWVLDIAAGAS